MNKKNRNKIVKEVAKVVEQKAAEEVSKPSFWSKVVKFLKYGLTFLIKSGLWIKLGISKYWKNAGIILALVGTTYNTVNDVTSTPEALGELITLTQYVDSLEAVEAAKDSIYSVRLDSLEMELSDYAALKNAIKVVK